MQSKLSFILLFTLILFFSAEFSFAQDAELNYWPQWRGPFGIGAAEKGNPPVQFGEDENLKWKTDIPGIGHATPIVWEDNIVIQTAVATSNSVESKAGENEEEGGRSWMQAKKTNKIHEFKVILVDRNNGQIKWEQTVVTELPHENTHDLGSWASNSPCTDGEFIYAYFGSRGLFCLDFEGKILWQKDFGEMEKHMSFGEGSSPYIYGDKIFIQWDHEGDSYLYALDKKTGKIDWKVERDVNTSWSTPTVVEVNGQPQVITTATDNITAYDFETGEVIWTSSGLTRNVIPNPIYSDGILYVMSGFRGSAMQAIDISKAKGDITNTDAILWTYNQHTPYTPQPLLMNEKLYFLRVNNGFLNCIDAKTGEPYYSNQNLEDISTLYSSPTGVNNRIYIAAENVVMVVKAGETFEVLASNELNDNFHASPVIVGNDLILRGFDSLYCFSQK